MNFKNKYTIFYLIFLTLFLPLKVGSQTSSVKLRVTEEIANIRQNPDIRSPILTQVTQNTILHGLKREGEWYLVTWADESGIWQRGYIHESLVAILETEIIGSEKSTETKETKEEKKTEVINNRKEFTQKPEPKKEKPLSPIRLPIIQPKKKTFKINLAPGFEVASLSQINEANAGLASLLADLFNCQQETKVSSLHYLPTASFEFQFPLKSLFSIIFQVSGISAQKENSISYLNGSSKPSLFIESKLKVLPISFLLNFEPLAFISLAAGPEIIFGEYQYLYRINFEHNNEEWSGYARAWSYGWRGKINFFAWLNSNLGISLEIGGRRAKMTNFQGKDTHLLISGEKAEEKGKLYFFQVRTSPDWSYSLLFIRNKRPAEAGVETANEASLNLSGLTIRLGLSFRF